MPRNRPGTRKPGHPNKHPKPELCGRPRSGGQNGDGAGEPCRRAAGWGTPNRSGPCRFHGGALPSVQIAYARQDEENYREAALERVKLWGERVDGARPLDQMSEELARTAGRVDALERHIIRRQAQAAHEHELTALGRELQAERAFLVQVAKAAKDAGLTEHDAQVQQEQGRFVATALGTVLELLDLDREQEEAARPLLRWALLGANPATRPPTVPELRAQASKNLALVRAADEREAVARAEREAAEEQRAQQRREYDAHIADVESRHMRLEKTNKNSAGDSRRPREEQ